MLAGRPLTYGQVSSGQYALECVGLSFVTHTILEASHGHRGGGALRASYGARCEAYCRRDANEGARGYPLPLCRPKHDILSYIDSTEKS